MQCIPQSDDRSLERVARHLAGDPGQTSTIHMRSRARAYGAPRSRVEIQALNLRLLHKEEVDIAHGKEEEQPHKSPARG